MEKVLNQEEIDAMVRAARGGADADSGSAAAIWDILKAGQIREDEMRALNLVHEGFTRALSNALGGYFRVAVEVKLVSAEYLPYEEFVERLPEGSYLASCRLSPLPARAVIELDACLILPIIDLLLGGQGKDGSTKPEITDIEEEILASTMRVVCSQLRAAWHALGLEFLFEQRQDPSQAQRIINVKERTLSLSFEIHMPEAQGTLNIAIPALAAHALLRKLSAGWTQKHSHVSADQAQGLRTRLLRCPFKLELLVEHLRVPLRELAVLSIGQLLVFQRPAESPASASIAGTQLFSATPARNGTIRAALITALTEKTRDC